MKLVLRRFPNNGGDSVPTDHLLSQTRLPILGLGCFQLSCWTKVFNGNLPPHTQKQTVSKTKGCSLKTNSRAQMLRKIPTLLILYEEVDLVTTWSLYPYILASFLQKGIMQVIKKRNVNTNPGIKSFDLQYVLSPKYARSVMAQSFWEQPTNV